MNRFALSLACLCLLAPTLRATPTISYVGTESGTTVQNWSNPAVPKTKDLRGDDRFGGAGYYQIMPAEIGTDNAGLTATAGNDLGVSLDISGTPVGTYSTASQTPTFLSGIPSGAAGQFINNTNFPNYRAASGTTELRQGAIWLLESNIQEEGTSPGGTSNWNTAFNFTLSQAAGFRLGVAVDNMSDPDVAPDYVSVFNTATGNVFSGALTRDGISDMVFFDIEGGAGDSFVVILWHFDFIRTAFALITFDQTSVPTLSYALNGDNITLSWEPEIPGWILESSTDLGVGDDWNPLPDANNDNSVTVPMTGVPKNFFRLRKNP